MIFLYIVMWFLMIDGDVNEDDDDDDVKPNLMQFLSESTCKWLFTNLNQRQYHFHKVALKWGTVQWSSKDGGGQMGFKGEIIM